MPQGTKSAVTAEARRLTPAQQRAAEIEAQEQRRAQQEAEADELASEIEGLVEEFVSRHGEKLSSSMERQIAAFRHETDAVVREVTRVSQPH